MAERVRLERDRDGVARLVLCAPERHNAIDDRFVDELAAAVQALQADRRVRALLLSAEGRSFTVGGDLRFFAGRPDGIHGGLAATVPAYHDALGTLAHLPFPVVAAVQGPCAGGGLGLVLPADVVLAAPGAVFATGFDKLGLSGDGGASWWLPRLIGARRARAVLIGGRHLDAPTALEWGLVTELVPAEELAARAQAEVRRLAAGPTEAFGQMRALLQGAADRSLRDGLAAETAALLLTGATADAQEGVHAFAERRAPHFTGGAPLS